MHRHRLNLQEGSQPRAARAGTRDHDQGSGVTFDIHCYVVRRYSCKSHHAGRHTGFPAGRYRKAAEMNAGFEVMTSSANFEELRSFHPRVVLLNLAPASLSCCDVLFSLRAHQATNELRVIAPVNGDAEARAPARGANVPVPESV